MRIGPTIIELGLNDINCTKRRETVRAVIINNDNQVLLVYSHLFNDYTFPGGGIKSHETHEEALKRELREELGANKFVVHAYFGDTEEIRYGIHQSNDTYCQISHYYLVHILETGAQHLIERERLHGLEPRWIEIDVAITHNLSVIQDEKHTQKGLKTVLIRENEVLNYIKERLSHEKI